jgi:hypothetical protein
MQESPGTSFIAGGDGAPTPQKDGWWPFELRKPILLVASAILVVLHSWMVWSVFDEVQGPGAVDIRGFVIGLTVPLLAIWLLVTLLEWFRPHRGRIRLIVCGVLLAAVGLMHAAARFEAPLRRTMSQHLEALDTAAANGTELPAPFDWMYETKGDDQVSGWRIFEEAPNADALALRVDGPDGLTGKRTHLVGDWYLLRR